MTVFCTYFDRNYLTRGLVLYESLARFLHPPELVVLALDRETEEALAALALPGVDVVPLAELYADQGYLNDWPDVVPGTIVVDRPGVGLAPWNFMRYMIELSTDPPTVNGDTLVFYHFQGVKQIGPWLWDTGLTIYGSMPRS